MTEKISEGLVQADAGADHSSEKVIDRSEWLPIETAPHDDYIMILVVVETPDGDLDHRLAMWEPENDDWTIFMAAWDPVPLCWLPLPALPVLR